MNQKNNRKGFTIVELVIVIAVIAILAAVLIPTFSGVIEKANNSKKLQELKNEYTTYAMLTAEEGTFSDDVVIYMGGTYYEIVDGKVDITVTKAEAEVTNYWNAATDAWGSVQGGATSGDTSVVNP